MQFDIRKFKQTDKSEILLMMKDFYSSNAVCTNGSDKIYEIDFETCISNSPFLEGYVFCNSQKILGYAMLSKSFSTEFGKNCIWLEDLYIKKEYRGNHIISEFIQFVRNINPNVIFKLEVEKENEHAIYVYKKCGFQNLPYSEMVIV